MLRIEFVPAVLLLALLWPIQGWADDPADRAKADTAAQNIFNSTCGWCHHDGGRAGGGVGPKLMATTRSDEFIINRIKNGKPGAMPAFGGLGDAEIEALARYIRNLKPEN
jgi:mono/diheme cytochrome c family protein